MESLKSKNVLLIGATGGIGSNTLKLLISSGANVFCSARSEEKLQKLMSDNGLDASNSLACDISHSENVVALGKAYFNKFATIDVLINAAGIGIIKPVDSLSETDFLKTIQLNLFGSFLLIKAFLPSMKEAKKGLIVHIPGILGKVPMAGAAAYSASKYGLVGMMQSVREEIKRTDIRITNLFLGGTDSPFWDSIDLRVQRDKMVTANEAARAIWFLCQQPASGVVSEMVLQPFNHQAI